jgi:hypothetical protein
MLPISFSGSSGVGGNDDTANRGEQSGSGPSSKSGAAVFNIVSGRGNTPTFSNALTQSAGTNAGGVNWTWIIGAVIIGVVMLIIKFK